MCRPRPRTRHVLWAARVPRKVLALRRCNRRWRGNIRPIENPRRCLLWRRSGIGRASNRIDAVSCRSPIRPCYCGRALSKAAPAKLSLRHLSIHSIPARIPTALSAEGCRARLHSLPPTKSGADRKAWLENGRCCSQDQSAVMPSGPGRSG